MNENINVVIGTPAYNGMVHTDFVHSLLGFGMAGVRFSLLSIGGESLITRARNSILARFLQTTSFSHLLFLDGDVFLDGKDLIKLLEYDKDVIGAPVALKTLQDGKPVFNISGNLGQQDGLLKVKRLGTAVMLLSRKVVEQLADHAKARGDVYAPNPFARGLGDPETIYDVFQVGVREGEYLSEDYWVCQQLLDMGHDIWVDLSVKTHHHGMQRF